MIKHIVMWRLKDEALGNDKQTNAQLIKDKLEALAGEIAEIRAIEVGIDFSSTSSSCDVVLYSEFDSKEALDAYQVHPKHEDVKDFVGQVCCERYLVDYEG